MSFGLYKPAYRTKGLEKQHSHPEVHVPSRLGVHCAQAISLHPTTSLGGNSLHKRDALGNSGTPVSTFAFLPTEVHPPSHIIHGHDYP